jgi:hypothetical protein
MSNYGPEAPGPASDPWEHSAPALADLELGYPHGHQPEREHGGSKALLVVLVGVLVVVLCGGGVAGLYLIGNRGSGAQHSGGSPASASLDPNTVEVGKCMVNGGSNDHPAIRIVPCGPHTYKVLSKIVGTTDKEQCRSVAGTDQVFFYDAHDQALNFVLCLQTL